MLEILLVKMPGISAKNNDNKIFAKYLDMLYVNKWYYVFNFSCCTISQ